ncbi:MAG: cyclase, partial [Rhodopirellula sp.]|nr:cyclase [Rhodopirellula sp.]
DQGFGDAIPDDFDEEELATSAGGEEDYESFDDDAEAYDEDEFGDYDEEYEEFDEDDEL